MDKKPLTKGKVHWQIGGIQAFAFQIFLSFNLIRMSFEIANETIPKPLAATWNVLNKLKKGNKEK